MPAVDDCSFFDFSHDITCTEKRYVVACVKTYDSTETYITVTLFKKKITSVIKPKTTETIVAVMVSSSTRE